MGQKITLYHGSDARIVLMSKKERADFFAMIDRVISKLWEVYKPYYTERFYKERLLPNKEIIYKEYRRFVLLKDYFVKCGKEIIYNTLNEKLSMLEFRYNGSGYYQYGSLYLAAVKETAKGYALRSYAGGELGNICYWMIRGMEILQLPEWRPDDVTQNEIARILAFAAEDKREPVVITIDGVDSDNLLAENGGDAVLFFDLRDKFGIVSDFKFRFIGELDLMKYPMEYIKPK